LAELLPKVVKMLKVLGEHLFRPGEHLRLIAGRRRAARP
jgi:hypothetical protein